MKGTDGYVSVELSKDYKSVSISTPEDGVDNVVALYTKESGVYNSAELSDLIKMLQEFRDHMI